MNSVTFIEAVRSFLLGNKVAGLFKSQQGLSHELLRKEVRRMRTEVESLNESDLLNQVKDESRRERFQRASWSLGCIELSQCWVWPKMGGIQWAAGRVPDVAAILAVHANEKGRYCTDTNKHEVFCSIARYLPVLESELPIHVFGEQGIHEAYNNLRKGQVAYDLDDGCHRAIAACLVGRTTLPAFVGMLPR